MSSRTEQFKFDLLDKVMINEIQRPGVVEVVRLDPIGRSYLVCYWNDSNRKSEWLYEWEISTR